jgi:hypothetical protein
VNIQLQSASGTPITVGDVTVTPWSQSLIVRLPFGGFVWNRPSSIVIERDGHVERKAILDVSRVLQVGIIAMGLVAAIGARAMSSRSRKSSIDEEPNK